MTRLLLVEDDLSLGATLQERLTRESYEVSWSKDRRTAREELSQKTFDLIILDLGLPDGSGFDLARDIKGQNDIPFIFMTAMNTAENRLEGYELGAEEFIPKPFHLKELLIRVRHVLENHRTTQKWRAGDCDIDLLEGSISTGNNKEFLAQREFYLLKLLIENRHRVVSRDEILNDLVGEDRFPSHRVVDNSIVKLRQSLRDDNGLIIRSVRGIGYQWIGS